MNPTLVTDNIDRLEASKLDPPRGWVVTFRSGNADSYHQMYVNGRLTDWTDTLSQRSFELDTESFPLEIVVAAVDRDHRADDLSDQLPSGLNQHAWFDQSTIVYRPEHQRETRIVVLGDHATGQIDTSPLILCDGRPEWLAQWGFGVGPFGSGGMGFDAEAGLGMGQGPFGAGGFGVEGETALLSAPLLEEGTHQVLLRVISESGDYTDGSIRNVSASPPPPPPASFKATNYDAPTNTLTLQIQGGLT